MPLFRKRPIEVSAIQWRGDNLDEIFELTKGSREVAKDATSSFLYVDTLEGRMRCAIGDYLIRGIKGEFYPCKPDIFEQTYEAVDVLQVS